MSTVDELRRQAEGGDADAQVELAFCNARGSNGTTQDFGEAFKWFRKAAEQGNAVGQYNLGVCYASGCGVTADMREAVNWYRLAAEQGDAAAQVNLGVCYQNGWGVTKDLKEAFKWYRKSAEQGNASGQSNLGRCFENGWGVVKNLDEAFKWYQLAAEQGNEDALHSMESLAKSGNKEAFSFISQLAHRGDERKQTFVGECYEHGWGTDKNLSEAIKWYHKAAERGRTNALRRFESLAKSGSKEAFDFVSQLAHHGDAKMQILIAECHQNGWGVTKDLTEALKLYGKAAEQGNEDALLLIESLVKGGSKEAFSFISQLAEQGDVKMQILIAECHENGWGVDKNLDKTFKWYQLAAVQGNKDALKSIFDLARRGAKEAIDGLLALAQQNNIDAQNMVGWCYEKGKGVNRDTNEAIKWYRKAAEHGDKKASWNLEYCIQYGNKDSFSCISTSTAAELSLKETGPLLLIESFDSSVTNPSGMLLSPDDKLTVIFRDEEPAMTVMFEAFTWKEKWRQENSIIRPQAFSPDGNFLLVCRKNSPTAAILDANTGAVVRELSGHTQKVNAAAWSSSNLIATGSDDKTIRISHPDGTLVRVLTGQEAAVIYLAFANDGNQIFSHSPHRKGVYLWDVAADTFRSPVEKNTIFAKISSDGSLIACVHLGRMEFYQANDKEHVSVGTCFYKITPITWSPDSKHLFAKNGQTLYIFHFTEEAPLCTSFHHSTDISAMAFFSGCDRILTIDNKGRVQHHLCLLENALPRAPVNITASQMPLSSVPLSIPKPSHTLQEALGRTRVLIERTLLPTSFQNLQRALQCINDSSVSDISARVRTENAIEDMFAQISNFMQSESHPESALETSKQSIAAIESAMQTLLSGNSSISLPTSLSLFSSSQSKDFSAEDRIAHAVPAALSKEELDVILRFSHNAHNKLRALEKVLSVRAASFAEAIIEFDNFASELRAKIETNSADFTHLVAQMKQAINVISVSKADDINAMDTSTNNKESKKSVVIIQSAVTSKSSEDNQSFDGSNEDDDKKDLGSMILLHEIRIPVGRVRDVKVSPDGNILAVAMSNCLFVFDARSKVELWKISSHTEHIAFSPTSTQLAAAIETEEDVVIFEAATGARAFTFDGHRGKASTVAWSNSNLIASSHIGETSILVRRSDGEVYGKYCEYSDVNDFSFSPDSTRLAAASEYRGLCIIDLKKRSNQEYDDADDCYFRSDPIIFSENSEAFRTAFSPDGSKVAYTSWHGAISVLDSKTLEKSNEFNGNRYIKADFSWSRNSRFVAVISPVEYVNDPFFKLLASDGNNQFGRDVFEQKILGDKVAFSPDGSEIITVHGETGLVQFWMSPLFITWMPQFMPSVEADNDGIPFGQLHVIPPIETHAVEHIIDRITTLIDRMDHPESFHRLVGLLHQIKNVSAILKIPESDADFLVIDSSPSSSLSSSSSSSSSPQTRIRKSTFESMLDFVNVNGKKLVELENKLLCQADMFSKALISYNIFVDELQIVSERHMDKLACFISYLNKPPMSADCLFHIKSVISSILHESVNQSPSAAT